MLGMFEEVQELETTVQLGVDRFRHVSHTLAQVIAGGPHTRLGVVSRSPNMLAPPGQHTRDEEVKNSNDEGEKSSCLVTPMPRNQQTFVAAWKR